MVEAACLRIQTEGDMRLDPHAPSTPQAGEVVPRSPATGCRKTIVALVALGWTAETMGIWSGKNDGRTRENICGFHMVTDFLTETGWLMISMAISGTDWLEVPYIRPIVQA